MAQLDHTQLNSISPQSAASEVVLIADDDEFFRMALRTILLKTVGVAEVIETSSLDEAVERLAESDIVSLALFDLAMPGMASAASLRAVRECFPQVQVAVVSASRRRSDILLALEAGAHGYIPKSLGVAELAVAVQTVRAGTIYVPASLADLSGTEGEPNRPLVSAATSQPDPDLSLTTRQRQVLEQMVQGLSNKEIARALKLGEGTVKVHVTAIFRSLGVTSRAAAVATATRALMSRGS